MRSETMHRIIDFLKRQYDETPRWALRFIENQEKIMTALTDLQSAIADLTTALTTNNAEIETLLTKITAPGTSDADVEAAVTSIRALIATNATEVAKAQAAVPA